MAGLSLSPVPGVDFACTAVRRCATQRYCIQLRDIQSSFLGRICHLLVLPSPVALRCVTEVKSYVWKIAYCVVQWSRSNTAEMNRCPHFEQLFWHISTRTRTHTCTHNIQTCHMCWNALNTHMHWQLNLPRPRQFAQSGIGSCLQLVQLKLSKPTI